MKTLRQIMEKYGKIKPLNRGRVIETYSRKKLKAKLSVHITTYVKPF